MTAKICSLMCLFLCCLSLHAMTAEDLVDRCKAAKQKNMSDAEATDYAYCTGFITGFTDATRLSQEVEDVNGKPITTKRSVCLPDAEISANELVLVFLKFTDDHPEVLHEYASFVVHNALVKAYPCKK
jgi:Rap1a immunity proteins